MVEDLDRNAFAAKLFERMHRFDFTMSGIKLFERAATCQLPVNACAPERQVRRSKTPLCLMHARSHAVSADCHRHGVFESNRQSPEMSDRLNGW